MSIPSLGHAGRSLVLWVVGRGSWRLVVAVIVAVAVVICMGRSVPIYVEGVVVVAWGFAGKRPVGLGRSNLR